MSIYSGFMGIGELSFRVFNSDNVRSLLENKSKRLGLPALSCQLGVEYIPDFYMQGKKIAAGLMDDKLSFESALKRVESCMKKRDIPEKTPVFVFEEHVLSFPLLRLLHEQRRIRDITYICFDYHIDKSDGPLSSASFLNYTEDLAELIWVRDKKGIKKVLKVEGPVHLSIDIDVLVSPRKSGKSSIIPLRHPESAALPEKPVRKKGVATYEERMTLKLLEKTIRGIPPENIVGADISEYGGYGNILDQSLGVSSVCVTQSLFNCICRHIESR